jgi:hypothetical protein
MCCYVATERQNTQETSMKTSDNGGLLGLLLFISNSIDVFCSFGHYMIFYKISVMREYSAFHITLL